MQSLERVAEYATSALRVLSRRKDGVRAERTLQSWAAWVAFQRYSSQLCDLGPIP